MLDEVVSEIRNRSEKRYVDISEVKLGDISFGTNGGGAFISIPEIGEFGLTKHSEKQLLERMGIPLYYYLKCPPELRLENVSYWIEKLADTNVFIRLDIVDERVRAVLSPQFVPLDNYHVISNIARIYSEMGIDILKVIKIEAGDEMFLRILNVETSGYMGGIAVYNSEIGTGSTRIVKTIFAKICKNGLIVPSAISTVFRKIHKIGYGLKGSVNQAIYDSLKSILYIDDLELIDRLDATRGERLGNYEQKLIEKHVSRYFSSKDMALISNSNTLFDIIYNGTLKAQSLPLSQQIYVESFFGNIAYNYEETIKELEYD